MQIFLCNDFILIFCVVLFFGAITATAVPLRLSDIDQVLKAFIQKVPNEEEVMRYVTVDVRIQIT